MKTVHSCKKLNFLLIHVPFEHLSPFSGVLCKSLAIRTKSIYLTCGIIKSIVIFEKNVFGWSKKMD